MSIEQQRRILIRQGLIFLVIATVLGLATATLPHPEKWLAAHLTALLTGPVLAVIGLVWRELRLTPGQRRFGLACGLISAYGGLAANSYAAIVNLPGPASNPGVAGDPTAAMIFNVILSIVVPTTIAAFGLAAWGMRGAAADT
jgi:hypothetical protein